MQKLTNKRFKQLILENFGRETKRIAPSQEVQWFIGGEVVHQYSNSGLAHEDGQRINHDVFFWVVENPDYIITSQQLCQIFDEGNHCISRGSIVYEDNYAYITWSNLGHI